MRRLLLLVRLLSLSPAMVAFTHRATGHAGVGPREGIDSFGRFSTPLLSSLGDDPEPPSPISDPPTAVSVEEEPGNKYPVDLPSPILLSGAMVLGIAGTGSSFELAQESPALGFITTAAIAALSIPLSLFLFYASILKAQAETEADDEEYMSGRGPPY